MNRWPIYAGMWSMRELNEAAPRRPRSTSASPRPVANAGGSAGSAKRSVEGCRRRRGSVLGGRMQAGGREIRDMDPVAGT